ncbi:MAG: multidrug transporter subunit MdtD [Janthinobacterium lividum]
MSAVQAPPAAQITPARHPASLNLMLWLVAIGFFMQTLDTTIVNTALPSMARSLGESPLRMQSVVISYALTMATLTPASGWFADRFGTRTVFVWAVVLFSAGSIACAMSTSLSMLVFARVVQGIGGANLLPVGRLAVLRIVPRERYLQAMSLIAIPGMIGPLIGPTLGGWLVQQTSWHWIFLINVPVGVLGCACTWLFMPNARTQVSAFDLKGFLLLAVGMIAISLSLDGLAELGLRHATVLVLLILSLACLCAYGLHATRRPHPLFSLDLFKIHTYSVGLLGNLFARIGSGAMPYLLPLLLQVSLGFKPMEAGMTMLPVAAAGMLIKRPVTPLINRLGYQRVLVINTLLVGLGIASFALFSLSVPFPVRLVQLALFGAVNSIQFTAMNALTLKDLGSEHASSGNSLFSMIQMLAMSLGVTVAGALLATYGRFFGGGEAVHAKAAFQATFVSIGIITAASAWIFAQVEPRVRAGAKSADPGEV